jgi:hypothetical protein
MIERRKKTRKARVSICKTDSRLTRPPSEPHPIIEVREVRRFELKQRGLLVADMDKVDAAVARTVDVITLVGIEAENFESRIIERFFRREIVIFLSATDHDSQHVEKIGPLTGR